MPHELRPDEIDRRERALRKPKDSSVTGHIRGALGPGLRSSGTPITERTIIDASPLHTRRDVPPPEPPDPRAGAAIAHAIRAATGTPIQKAKAKAKPQGAQGGAAAGGPTEGEAEGKKPNRRPSKKKSKTPDPDAAALAKGLREVAARDPRFHWTAAVAERHAAMTASRPQ